LIAEGLEEKALVGFTGHDYGSTVATLEQSCATIDAQTPLDVFRPGGVALIAASDQDGTNLLLEEFDPLSIDADSADVLG
jgi:hypothetical protein